MVKEAEKYKAEDERYRKKVEAKNALEKCAYSIGYAIRDEEIASQLSLKDKKKIESVIKQALLWIDANQLAEVNEFEQMMKQLESIFNRVIQSIWDALDGDGAPGAAAAAAKASHPGISKRKKDLLIKLAKFALNRTISVISATAASYISNH